MTIFFRQQAIKFTNVKNSKDTGVAQLVGDVTCCGWWNREDKKFESKSEEECSLVNKPSFYFER